jgi:hypothetical protein
MVSCRPGDFHRLAGHFYLAILRKNITQPSAKEDSREDHLPRSRCNFDRLRRSPLGCDPNDPLIEDLKLRDFLAITIHAQQRGCAHLC